MSDLAVVLAAGSGERFGGPVHKLRAVIGDRAVLSWTLDALLGAGFDEVAVVVGSDPFEDLIPDGIAVLQCGRWAEGQALSLQLAVAHATEGGFDGLVVGVADQPLVPATAWRLVREQKATPITVASFEGFQRPPTRLSKEVWATLPAAGDSGARGAVAENRDLVTEVMCPGDPMDLDTEADLAELRRRAADRLAVVRLLGREPMGSFEVVVRGENGDPVVLLNYPLLYDGRPMPTMYWLCGEAESKLVGRLESRGGVKQAEREIGLEAITEAHERYRRERDALLHNSMFKSDHLPTGGVGGTRTGLKCLHAHYAWWLAGGEDPVGEWVSEHL